MATVNLTITPVQIDDGTSASVLVTNTGASDVELSRGGRLRPAQSRTVYPEGTVLSAAALSGTGQVSTVATAAPTSQAAQVAANTAAIAGLPGTYATIPLALAPQFRTLPKKLAPTMATIFATGHGYGSANTSAVNLNDTSDYVLGTQSATVTTTGAGTQTIISKAAAGTFDMTGKVFGVLVKVTGMAHLKQLSIYVGSSTFANYFLFHAQASVSTTLSNEYVQDGQWMWLVFPWTPNATSGSPVRSAITDLRVAVYDDNTGNTVKLQVNAIATFPQPPTAFPNGVVSIGFDDCNISQWTLARSYMDKYGYGATNYVIWDQVGADANHLSLAQLKSLEAVSSWEVSAHAYTLTNHNAGFDNLSASALDAELYQLKSALVTNGFRGADHLGYPLGQYNSQVITAASKYFKTGRLASQRFQETLPTFDAMRIKTLSVTPTVSAATVTAAIDSAYSAGAHLVLLFHDITAGTATGSQTTVTTFNTIIDYLSTKGIPVQTLSDVLRQL